MSVILPTASLSAADRVKRWREVVSRAFIQLDVDLLEDDPLP